MDALVAEDDQRLPMAERGVRTDPSALVRSQTIAMLSTLLTPEDWQKLAAIAAEGMANGVLQVLDKPGL